MSFLLDAPLFSEHITCRMQRYLCIRHVSRRERRMLSQRRCASLAHPRKARKNGKLDRTQRDGLPATNLKVRSAVFLAGAGPIARGVERLIPRRLPLGAFIVIAGDAR
jgi:hypothetical protein